MNSKILSPYLSCLLLGALLTCFPEYSYGTPEPAAVVWDQLFEEIRTVQNDKIDTQALAKHCALEWNPQCLDFHERVEASYTFSEMQVREPLNNKGVGAWRRYEEQLEPLFDALARYGLSADA